MSQATREPVQVVAFNLGTCNNQYEYRGVEWYFPQHGQTFDPTSAINLCPAPAAGSNTRTGITSYPPA